MDQAYAELVERQAARHRSAARGFRSIPHTNAVAYPQEALLRQTPPTGTFRPRASWQPVATKLVTIDGVEHVVQVMETYEEAKARRKQERTQRLVEASRARVRVSNLAKAREVKANKRIKNILIGLGPDKSNVMAVFRQHLMATK